MQNKGAIKLVAIALALVALYQLSFTFHSNKVKKRAAEYATIDGNNVDYFKEAFYLDSMGNEEAYNFFWLKKYTFNECQQRELNLGLDLRGGMNVILQVSISELVKGLANNSQDPIFLEALATADEQSKTSSKEYITLFGDAYKKLAPEGKLATIFAQSQQLKGQVTYTTSNDDVLKVLAVESKSAIDNSFNILRTRIDRFGVAQPNIQELDGKAGRILIELPGVKDERRVRNLLQRTAMLEFYETYDVTEVFQYLKDANGLIKKHIAKNEIIESDTNNVVNDKDTTESIFDNIDQDSLINNIDTIPVDNLDQQRKDNPLFALLVPITNQEGQLIGGAAVGFSQKEDREKINEYLALPEVKALFPRDLRFVWSVKSPYWDKTESVYELIAIKTDSKGNAKLTGDAITNARHDFDQMKGSAEVSMTMNGSGAQTWANLTRENVGKQIAIVLDNYVYSYPNVNGEIKGGSSQITGNFSISEAQDLANVLKSGKLPISVSIEELNHVGPSLGKESINAGLTSFLIAFLLVLVYMVFYYKGAGLVANIALIANMFFIVGVLASLGAVLTLPGIAGIVLTIGMSVDANVIIYERIKEELRNGKGMKLAIKDGYKNAYSAIIDANITTLLTGIILYTFGHGPIQGFATTLVIGILTSLFTAIFITRLIFEAFLDRDKTISFSTKITENILSKVNFDFLAKRKVFYIISGAIIILGIASLSIRGLNQGVDFVGGRSYVVRFEENTKANTVEIAEILKEEFGEAPEVKTYGATNQVKITTKYEIDNKTPEIENKIDDMLYSGLKTFLPEGTTLQQFLDDYRLNSQKVGATIAHDIKISAIYSVLFSLLVIFLYIFIRFKNWQYGLGATVALVHDSIIVLGIFSIFYGILPFSLEINQAFIAALLTVVGYSVNDTVVVFDRVREFFNLHPKRDTAQNINSALNSTLTRTLNTSVTTFFVLLIIFLFGGEVIRGFVFALMIGVLVGTYSSLFIATPIAFDTLKKASKKIEAKKELVKKEITEEAKEAQQKFINETKEEQEKRLAEELKRKEKRMKRKKKKNKLKK